MESTTLARPVAIKCRIHDIIQGSYVQESDQKANYILTASQQKLYKINVIGIIVEKEQQGSITDLILEDGTGTMVVRFFENHPVVARLQAGDIILVLGKVRVYNQDKYISPEIVKRTSPLWLKVRTLELPSDSNIKLVQSSTDNSTTMQPIINNRGMVLENPEQIETIEESGEIIPVQKILQLIKNLDHGEGVLIEEILERSPLKETERILEKMLQNGDIFQNLPGKVKLL